jgi:hypothetical protein
VLQLVTFEAFRDLVKLLQLGFPEETGIMLAEDENIELRASAKSTAVGQLNLQAGQAAGPQPGSTGAGARCHLTNMLPFLMRV